MEANQRLAQLEEPIALRGVNPAIFLANCAFALLAVDLYESFDAGLFGTFGADKGHKYFQKRL